MSKLPSKLHCLVMAGGQGTRFWPQSTSKRPKQYLCLVSEDSLLKCSLDRFDGLVDINDRHIVTVKDQEVIARDCSKEAVAHSGFIFEPAGRNTAPCILLSLAQLISNGASKDELVAVVPSDHVILNSDGFRKTLVKACQLSFKENLIVTIGITPNFPHTGYGYVKKGKACGEGHSVSEFKEKPDVETAKGYVASGEYLWNAGMFVSKIGTFLAEFEKCSPEMFSHFSSLVEAIGDEAKVKAIYEKLEKISIDYAVMEKSSEVGVVAAEFDWNDLGSWDALESVIEKKDENTIVSSNDYYVDNAKGNIVFTPDKFCALINVDDLIVVSDEKTVLVLPKKDSQKVKEVVAHLKNHNLNDLV